MSWWRNQWLLLAILLIIVFLVIQMDVDIFNAAIRGIVNLFIFDYLGSALIVAIAVIILIAYYFYNKSKEGK